MDFFARYLPALEDEMRQVTTIRPGAPPLIYGMIHYHLGWCDGDFRPAQINAGKRLRPVFLLLADEAQGGAWRQALPAAAAAELLHNFTLIHDDIEDRDRFRRGRPTLWAIWGEAQAINAGDALFSISYRALLRLREKGVPDERVLRVIDRYTETLVHLTEGQCRDISFEQQDAIDEESYLRMIRGKTAALVGLVCEVGGIVAGAPDNHTSALRDFGEAVGLAFQMQDDLLGLWGDSGHTGKPVGADLRRRKKSLPILHGAAHSEELRALLRTERRDDDFIAEALALLEDAGSRTHTEERARHYHDVAMEALERSGGSGPAQEALHELCGKLLNRRK